MMFIHINPLASAKLLTAEGEKLELLKLPLLGDVADICAQGQKRREVLIATAALFSALDSHTTAARTPVDSESYYKKERKKCGT